MPAVDGVRNFRGDPGVPLHERLAGGVRAPQPKQVKPTKSAAPSAAPQLSLVESGDIVRDRMLQEQPFYAGPGLRPQLPTAACVLDWDVWEPQFYGSLNLLPITPKNLERVLGGTQYDLLLCQPAWRQPGFAVMNDAATRKRVLETARQRGIPSVFINTEDPFWFDRFLPWTEGFDCIVTSAEECVNRYRLARPHAQVLAQPFACDPLLHHARRAREAVKSDCLFGGCYYPNHERERRIGELLPPLLSLGLEIRARPHRAAPELWPERLRSAVRPGLDHARFLDEARRHAVHVNLSSVLDSPTMCAMRTFELAGMGAFQISNDALGVRAQMPMVPIARDADEMHRLAARALEDPLWRIWQGWRARMHALRHHTWAHRLAAIGRVVGLRRDLDRLPKVSVLAPTRRPGNWARLWLHYVCQTWENKELLILAQAEWYAEALRFFGRRDGVRVIPCGTTNVGGMMNRGIAAAEGQYLTKMDDDDAYAPEHLENCYWSLIQGEGQLASLLPFLVHLEHADEYRLFQADELQEGVHEVTWGTGNSLFWPAETTRHIRFREFSVGSDSTFIKDVRAQGLRMVNVLPFTCVVSRRGSEGHTWKVGDDYYRDPVFSPVVAPDHPCLAWHRQWLGR